MTATARLKQTYNANDTREGRSYAGPVLGMSPTPQ
jgi:hypothetical protein